MENKYCTLNNSKLIWKIEKTKNNKVYLTINNKKLTTTLDNITVLEDYVPEKYNKTSITTSSVPSSEIMLRHLSKLEAIQKLDKFMDTAIINRIPKVKIIHGKNRRCIKKSCS